jgi:hypothetical protein
MLGILFSRLYWDICVCRDFKIRFLKKLSRISLSETGMLQNQFRCYHLQLIRKFMQLSFQNHKKYPLKSKQDLKVFSQEFLVLCLLVLEGN